MRSLLAILIFFALAEPRRHVGDFRFGTMIFPNPARSLALRPKPRLRRPRRIFPCLA